MEYTNQLNEQLELTLSSLSGYWSEFIIAIGIVVILIVDLVFYKKENDSNWWVGFINLGFVGLAIAKQFSVFYTYSVFGEFMKLILLSGALLFVLFSLTQKEQIKKAGEYHIIFNGLLIGALLLAKATNLLIIYLGVEMMSICAYILSGFSFSKQSAEASVKYLLFGAVSSAVMLFGMSLLYGFAQGVEVSEYDLLDIASSVGNMPVKLALFMTMFGFLFKIAAAPMHIWSPDVYQAAPTPVVAAFSVLPKLAVFGLLFNVAEVFFVFREVELLLQVVAILSLTVGNFAALWQKDVKRMLAYSSIAHTGFLLIAFFANQPSFLFYAIVYMVMNIAVFGLARSVERKFGITNVDQYKGLGKVIPFTGVLFVIVLISLTGLPPAAGFNAKLFVFSGMWEKYSMTNQSIFLFLFLFGLLNTVVSLFYYLRIPYFLFIKNNEEQLEQKKHSNAALNYLMVILVFVLLLWFFIPNSLMDIIYSISFAQ